MKDGYSFDADDAGAERSYAAMYQAYTRIFQRCGLKFQPVEAMTGQIGGSFSHEFMVLADTGEDVIAVCDGGDYAANLEKAESRPTPPLYADEEPRPLEKIETPNQHTVEEVTVFLQVPATRVAKTLIYQTDKGPVAAVVRGDDELNVEKLRVAAGVGWATLATEKEILEVTGGPLGFSGPVGLQVPLFLDRKLQDEHNLVTGANAPDLHYLNTNPGRDFAPTAVADLRVVKDGDGCPRCEGTLRLTRGIEVGHVFKLGLKYSKAMNATFLDPDGKEQFMVMGCYGIGTSRTVAAAIEQNHDEAGIIWPLPLAPFQVYVLPVNVNDAAVKEAGERVYRELTAAGVEVIYDDRDERAGVKFKDADLLGIPLRITIGAKNLKNGQVEFKPRTETQATLVALNEAGAKAREFLRDRS